MCFLILQDSNIFPKFKGLLSVNKNQIIIKPNCNKLTHFVKKIASTHYVIKGATLVHLSYYILSILLHNAALLQM